MKSLMLTLLFCLCVVIFQSKALAQQSSELSGYVTSNNQPAKGVTISIGAYSLLTDGNGYYRFPFLRSGTVQVRVAPPNKQPRVFPVAVGGPTKRNFPINW